MNHFKHLSQVPASHPGVYVATHVKQVKRLYLDIADASHSCQAIARVVHKNSYERWTDADRILMVQTIEDLKLDIRCNKSLVPVALLLGRSPCAIRDQYHNAKRVAARAARKALLAKITTGAKAKKAKR